MSISLFKHCEILVNDLILNVLFTINADTDIERKCTAAPVKTDLVDPPKSSTCHSRPTYDKAAAK